MAPQKRSAGLGFELKHLILRIKWRVFSDLGAFKSFYSKKRWTLNTSITPNHPTNNPTRNPRVFGPGLGSKNRFHQFASGTRRGTAGRMRCPARSGSTPGWAGGHDWGRWHGTGVFWGGQEVVFFSAVWVERRILIQRKMMQPLKRHVGCVGYLVLSLNCGVAARNNCLALLRQGFDRGTGAWDRRHIH